MPSYQFYIHPNLSQFHNPRYNISLYHIRKVIQDLVEGKNKQPILTLNKKVNDWKNLYLSKVVMLVRTLKKTNQCFNSQTKNGRNFLHLKAGSHHWLSAESLDVLPLGESHGKNVCSPCLCNFIVGLCDQKERSCRWERRKRQLSPGTDAIQVRCKANLLLRLIWSCYQWT